MLGLVGTLQGLLTNRISSFKAIVRAQYGVDLLRVFVPGSRILAFQLWPVRALQTRAIATQRADFRDLTHCYKYLWGGEGIRVGGFPVLGVSKGAKEVIGGEANQMIG